MFSTTKTLLISAGLCAILSARAAAGPYERVAADIAEQARKSGCRRLAVLPFQPANHGQESSGLAMAERILTHLVAQDGMEVVERTLLKGVLQELELGAEGVVDAAQTRQFGRVLGVDALVTGTFLDLGRGVLELHARLIDAQTARILGAVTARIDEDWTRDPFWSDSSWDVPPPNLSGAPKVSLLPDLFRDAAGPSTGCGDWEQRAQRLQAATLDLKARYWASRLREASFRPEEITRNPGSEFRSLALRQEFYRRTQSLYRSGYRERLSSAEEERMDRADRQAEKLFEDCY
jgi:TolB-like protein